MIKKRLVLTSLVFLLTACNEEPSISLTAEQQQQQQELLKQQLADMVFIKGGSFNMVGDL